MIPLIPHAAIPGWVLIIVVLSAMGPMMRMIFGDYANPRRGKRLDKRSSEEIERLDAALAERDTVIEDLQRRLNEMESRLDFTERMLARPKSEQESNLPV